MLNECTRGAKLPCQRCRANARARARISRYILSGNRSRMCYSAGGFSINIEATVRFAFARGNDARKFLPRRFKRHLPSPLSPSPSLYQYLTHPRPSSPLSRALSFKLLLLPPSCALCPIFLSRLFSSPCAIGNSVRG